MQMNSKMYDSSDLYKINIFERYDELIKYVDLRKLQNNMPVFIFKVVEALQSEYNGSLYSTDFRRCLKFTNVDITQRLTTPQSLARWLWRLQSIDIFLVTSFSQGRLSLRYQTSYFITLCITVVLITTQ